MLWTLRKNEIDQFHEALMSSPWASRIRHPPYIWDVWRKDTIWEREMNEFDELPQCYAESACKTQDCYERVALVIYQTSCFSAPACRCQHALCMLYPQHSLEVEDDINGKYASQHNLHSTSSAHHPGSRSVQLQIVQFINCTIRYSNYCILFNQGSGNIPKYRPL